MSSSFDLSGKVALITGGSRGIGYAMAEKFLEQGADLIIASRTQKDLDEAAETLSKNGRNVLAVSVHTGDEISIQSMVKRGLEKFGGIDIVVNNAATNPHYGPLFTSDDAQWDKIWDVNVKGYYKVTKACVPSMIERGGGKIINLASIAGKHALPGMGIYCISKSAVIMLTKVLGQELAKSNIQANAIAPGFIKTKFSSALWMDEKVNEWVLKSIPQRRMAEPEEIAGIALYLASDASSFATGEVFTVDGGQTI
ncbi:MAG: SDR family oxidoreductase [Candidatus Marinimicrobia bacterium]|nr:SDR family oxidoreductase [Candidatus Neomarinimicrobiota bacterium]